MGDSYMAFGRGTPAGDAIFKLYYKPQKPSTYDPEIAKLLAEQRKKRELMSAPPPKVIPKSRAHVNVPKPGRRRYSAGDFRALPSRFNRKQQATIEAEQREAGPLPPLPEKKHISEADKQRLQLLMQHNGKIPEAPPPKPKPKPKELPKYSTKEMFDMVLAEINEREEFLREMRELGRTDHDAKLKREIAQRVAELRRLDKLLREEEGVAPAAPAPRQLPPGIGTSAPLISNKPAPVNFR
eukprot:TRINITY_DN60507_c0_g1_i1.p1 TRINITY_DN60507_c0_g1~~TRINITY_DN60507_c0_g1_i1.p1  ORF type:complete len:255 (-),score=32.50 TRINITY_DN60507_c0_g1_i1:413-1132(-)